MDTSVFNILMLPTSEPDCAIISDAQLKLREREGRGREDFIGAGGVIVSSSEGRRN